MADGRDGVVLKCVGSCTRMGGWPIHSRSVRMSGGKDAVRTTIPRSFVTDLLPQHRRGGRFEGERENVWQRRFYDFNVWTERKRIERLRYMHRNPVKRGLVSQPEQWLWSSIPILRAW